MTTDARELNGFIDIDSEASPLVERDRLYRLWEEHNWSAKNLDFTQDAIDWQEKHTEQQRRAILWNYAMFLDGEESVTVTLAPFLNAVPRYEDRIYLATQVADEARHHVFFDRFLREVCHIGQDYQSTLEATRSQLNWGYRQVFTELDRVSDRLRRSPNSLPLLAQGVALYHLVVEGMLAHSGQHFLRDYSSKTGLFPGFSQGITMISRDESRHIAFGIQLLRELVTSKPECKAAALEILERVLPWASGVFAPPNCDWEYVTCLGYSPQEVFAPKRLARQLAPTQAVPAGAPGPQVAILQSYHLRPVPVEHQHTAKDIFADRDRVNSRRCYHYLALRIEQPAVTQPIDARARILQPAQMRRKLLPVPRHRKRAQHLRLRQLSNKFFLACHADNLQGRRFLQ